MNDVVANDQVFFTAAPGADVELPPPFVAAGRSVILAQARSPSVLILGYGLGAMAAIMLERRPSARIIGIEISEVLYRQALSRIAAGGGALGSLVHHVTTRLGRGPGKGQIQLIHTNARDFLARTRRQFDLILDDCFLLTADHAMRDPETCASASQMAARLTPSGIVVRNLLVGPREPLEPQIEDLRQTFRHVQLRRFRDWENVLAIANQKEPLDTQRL